AVECRACTACRLCELGKRRGKPAETKLELRLDERDGVGARRKRDAVELRHGLAQRKVRDVDRDHVDNVWDKQAIERAEVRGLEIHDTGIAAQPSAQLPVA